MARLAFAIDYAERQGAQTRNGHHSDHDFCFNGQCICHGSLRIWFSRLSSCLPGRLAQCCDRLATFEVAPQTTLTPVTEVAPQTTLVAPQTTEVAECTLAPQTTEVPQTTEFAPQTTLLPPNFESSSVFWYRDPAVTIFDRRQRKRHPAATSVLPSAASISKYPAP